ncbi:hypothetical protein PCC6912_44820 [Chlorogloeopsis fritschii PCC 6912]|uniref:Uncharacterized protein n=1 Tax=Chlorogloeopsis fritschii PCC 6912 TaxID=211165 RepID=A0A3S1ACN9_CHLFR|nr:hypothetical protein PCC6912_44820 [Chlorogloeopsis fritschii PCC 6912]
MFTTTTTQELQKAHARYISTVGMLATIYDKNNFETLEQNYISDARDEWKNNYAEHIAVVWEGW